MPLTYRTLWLSDVHLGTPACRAADLLHFLDDVSAERIYLVGDIVDLIELRGRIRFPATHHAVIRRLTELAASGSELIYIPGNHDYPARDFVGRQILGAEIRFDTVHVTGSGLRLLVTHGDVLDGEIRRGANLEVFGAAAYRMLMQLDAAVNRLRSRMGQDYLSVSRRIKTRIASAREYIERFERVAARHARDYGFDGIVCGHIHKPALRMIDGVLYANDGDWVEHRTALAETADGRLELLQFTGDDIGIAVLDRRADQAVPVAA